MSNLWLENHLHVQSNVKFVYLQSFKKKDAHSSYLLISRWSTLSDGDDIGTFGINN